MSYFCLSITFLDAEYHGRCDGDGPEWPPSPLRLFQALLAAAAARRQEPPLVTQASLKWLESQSPPLIVTPQHHVGVPTRIAVPNNDWDTLALAWARGQEPRKQPAELKTMKTVRPIRLLDGETVVYLWVLPDPLPDCIREHIETLSRIARSLVALGWGIDLIAAHGRILSAQETDRIPGQRWQPITDAGIPTLRVPVQGTLEALINRHKAFLGRLRDDRFTPVPPLTAFRIVSYRRVTDPPSRRWAAFRLWHPTEDRHAFFPQIRANHVAAMLRNATARLAEQQHMPPDWIDRYVHGHRRGGDDSSPRFSYLPLPSLEPRSGKSTVVSAIRRVLVAELMDTVESHRPWVRQMLPGNFLTDDKTGDRKALLTPLGIGDCVLEQYTEKAATWATVTPVVLPGSDEGKFAKAEKLFFKALRHAGYAPEALAELEFRNVSFWPGGDLALRFCRPDYLKENFWSVYHVRLRWKHPVQGPIALGAGRHCGLGVFARMEGATRMD